MNDTDVQIRVYPEEKALIRARARHHGLSTPSTYYGWWAQGNEKR